MEQLYSEQEYQKTYNYIKNILIESKYTQEYPIAILIGGQPGSGKSQLTKHILRNDENTISIDGDSIREYHPNLEKIEKQYGTDYPKFTQPFVNRVVEQLIDELSKEKYNLIIEGTLRDINVPLKTASLLNNREYTTELYVIATNKEISWESTIKRGNEMKNRGKIPRYVEKSHHDKVVKTLPKTVEELSKNKMFSNVVIMDRNENILYDKNEMQNISPKGILEDVLNGNRENIKEDDEKHNLDEMLKIAKEEVLIENKSNVQNISSQEIAEI